ncbi:MAG: ABC transporter substrate-binding protein [Clostridia bacterium]|nr:ABC transporter substrate-binding protein [Clostridia bacterium]
MTGKIISLFLCVMMLAGCGPALAEDTQVTVTDMAGRRITLDAPAERVVVLQPGDAEILYAIGAGSTVVGRGAYVDWPEEVLGVPSVMSGYETNLEEIIALSPQAVIMTVMSQTEEQVKALEDAGIRVIVTDAQSLEDIYACVALLGAVVGRNDEAEELIASMRAELAGIAAEAKALGSEGKTFYYEESPLQWGLWAGGSGIFFDDLCAMMGLKNIFGDLSGHNSVSEEQVLALDPDLIFTTTMYYGEGPAPDEEIASRAGWENVSAVKTGAILFDNTSSIARPGPRVVDAAEMILELLRTLAAEKPAA